MGEPSGRDFSLKKDYRSKCLIPFLGQTQPHSLDQYNDNLLFADGSVLAHQLDIYGKGFHILYFYHILE